MAKRGRPRIYAPRIPIGEKTSTTLAMQEKQIKLLVDRCEELERQRTAAFEAADDAQHQLKGGNHLLDSMRDAHTRLLGWQDCARELFAGGTNPFTTSSTPGG